LHFIATSPNHHRQLNNNDYDGNPFIKIVLANYEPIVCILKKKFNNFFN